MELIKHWFTEKDNKTWDMSKAMGAYAFIHFHAMVGYTTYMSHVFDMQQYGIGVGALFTTLGVLFGLKKDSDVATS